MQESLDAGQLANSTEIARGYVGGLVHAWAPHHTLALYGCSCVVFILAVLTVSVGRRRANKKMALEDYWRVGFAAGPIPIYLLLPLSPLDPDLAQAILDQPFQLLLAAAAGVMWTVTDIRMLVNGTSRP